MTVFSQNSKTASDQVSERGTEPSLEPDSFARIYEQCMTETESSHIWYLKNE